MPIIWHDPGSLPAFSGNEPEMPAFLDRSAEPRLSDDALRRITSNRRDWATGRPPTEPIERIERITEVAKADIAISNPAAPVEIWTRADENAPAKTFPNLAAFEGWYRPKAHRIISTTNGPDLTLIILDTMVDVWAEAPVARARPPAPPQVAPEPAKATPTQTAPGSPGTVGPGVAANGVAYGSLKDAFIMLRLPSAKRDKFAAALAVAGGALAFTHKGKEYLFELAPRAAG